MISSLLKGLGAGAVLLASSSAMAATVVVTVNGNDNPFLAGQPSGTACCGGDSAPAHSPALALSGFNTSAPITFSAVGGFSFVGGVPGASPDGSGVFTMSDYLNISGPQNVNLDGLVGVFVAGGPNAGAMPAKRNDGISFTTLSPALYQVFWIGDGLTGTGTGSVQQFFAPAGATDLYLGSSDGFGWFNNSGVVTATISFTPLANPVPEPSTWAMMLLGFGFVGVGMRAIRRRQKLTVSYA